MSWWTGPSRLRRRRRTFLSGIFVFSLVSIYLGYQHLYSPSMADSSSSPGFEPAVGRPEDDAPKQENLAAVAPPPPAEAASGGEQGSRQPVADSQPPQNHHRKRVSPADLPMEYGTNARPKFKDLVQLGTIPQEHIPSRQNHKRLIIVGDVHGMLLSLEALLAKIGFDPSASGKADHLVFAGDMVNKGPDSPGVVSLAMKAGASAVRGNHEDRVLLAKTGMQVSHVADAVDGTGSDGDDPNADNLEQEVFSHGDYADRNTARSLSKTQLEWLANLPVILQAGPVESLSGAQGELLVVHGGLVPGLELDRQDPWAVMNMRSLLYPREVLRRAEVKAALEALARRRLERQGRARPGAPLHLPPISPALIEKEYQHRLRGKGDDHSIAVPVDSHEGRRWTKAWNDFQKTLPAEQRSTVVFGHDAKSGLSVDKHTIGLDTGCVKGGKLSALVIEGTSSGVKHKVVHVNCVAPAAPS